MAVLRLRDLQNGDLRSYSHEGRGDDIVYVHDNFNYTIKTHEGHDQVFLNTVTSYTALNRIDLGDGDDYVLGSNAGREIVSDGAGSDLVLTAGGNDDVIVGAGDDYLDGGLGFDMLDFGFGNVGVFVDLTRTTAQYFGSTFGTDIIRNFEGVFGTQGHDAILGTNATNVLAGFSGNDQLIGRGGDDIIGAGDGADHIVGGLGFDLIQLQHLNHNTTPDAFRDHVIYESFADSGLTSTTRDIIEAFDRGGVGADDVFDLRALDGNAALAGDQALLWRNTGAFTTDSRGEVRIQDLGADVLIWIDSDNDTAAEMSILVKGVGTMDAADFLL